MLRSRLPGMILFEGAMEPGGRTKLSARWQKNFARLSRADNSQPVTGL
jgi:hypothetical protein